MGKINNYAETPSVKLSDKIIGSDGDTDATKNLTVESIVNLAIAGAESIYRFVATQASTTNPTFTELPNNTLEDITWTRTGIGDYNGYKLDAFTGTVHVVMGSTPAYGTPQTFQLDKVDSSNIRLRTAVSGSLADGAMTNQFGYIIHIA